MSLFGTLVTGQGHLLLKKAFGNGLRKGENGTMELKIEHLCKQFKDKKAVDDASLTLTPGYGGCLALTALGKLPLCA